MPPPSLLTMQRWTSRPKVQALICDDALQFNWLTYFMMLCWVHEGRPYKKLLPVVPLHRELLDGFLPSRCCAKRFWEYYDQLLTYRQSPSAAERLRLEAEFDSLFSTQTGYDELDKRIAKTQAKKPNLLLAADIRISMDGRGRAMDNIFTERLWRSVKYEEVYLNDYAGPRDARQGLVQYFDFYRLGLRQL